MQSMSDTITVLLADDDEIGRKYTKDVLTMSGYQVIEAVDGEEAVSKFVDGKDDIGLLIFDIMMPNKTGIEAYSDIVKFRPEIGVVFISGYADGMALDTILQRGYMFIPKPYSPDQLLSTINGMLSQ